MPISAAAVTSAGTAREKAAKRLELKCLTLDSHLPAEGDTPTAVTSTPTVRVRTDGGCPDCARELEQILEPEAREGHVCTHERGTPTQQTADRIAVTVATYKGHEEEELASIGDLLKEIDARLETLSDRNCDYTALVTESAAEPFEENLGLWTSFVGKLASRARAFMRALKDAASKSSNTPNIQQQQIFQLEDVPAGRNDGNSGDKTTGNDTEQSEENSGELDNTNGRNDVHNELNLRRGVAGTDLNLAVDAMCALSDEVEADLASAETESTEEDLLPGHAVQLKEYCDSIELKIDTKLRDAVEKVKRLDVNNATNAGTVFSQKIPTFKFRIRNMLSILRRASSCGNSVTPNVSPAGSVNGNTGSEDSANSQSVNGFKPYIEKLKLPVFSGKVEDWPEFRAIFMDMMSNVPETAKIQYLKSNLPAKDVRQISGLTTLADAWERLERTYGNVQLNIITVKGNLEKFQSNASQDHRRVMDVFEAVERAVTQLTRLGSVEHVKGDLGLIHKLVSKLPKVTQAHYAEYLASPIVYASVAPEWSKFWEWFQGAYKAAIQTNLIQLSSEDRKSDDLTCRICGKLGHFARKCPRKSASSSGSGVSTAKVNVSVAQISSRSDYDKGLQETKNKIGSCPSCSGTIHMYKKKFSFGEADWPSRRLAACPAFQSRSPKERGELVETLQACYVCTSTGHQANACFLKSKSNCTVITGGKACAASHHHLLHNTGVAYIKKVHITGVTSTLRSNRQNLDHSIETTDEKPPHVNQPVLLEVQTILIKDSVIAKIMWDNGSSGALVTHRLAELIGAKGEQVSYWLDVVGHPRILRHTTLYTFSLVDINGVAHTIQAYGIDRISDDSRVLDLRAIRQIFPEAPDEVFERPVGDIDILIGSMYINLHPYGGDGSCTRGRLRLLRSNFGCGFVLSGTHSDIKTEENTVCRTAKILVDSLPASRNEIDTYLSTPVLSCNRSVAQIHIPEFFEAEEMGVRAPKACKRCLGCKDCSFRGEMISRDNARVVRRLEDLMEYDENSRKVTVSYPWTEDIRKLTDNIGQAIAFQKSCEKRLLRDPVLLEAYNAELRKAIDRGAIVRLTERELQEYDGPISYVAHHDVHKPDSTTTPLRVVTNTSLRNVNAGLSPNECMEDGPNALSSLLEVLIGFRMSEVGLVYDMTKAYQSINTRDVEKHVRRIVWRWGDVNSPWEILAYNVVTFGDKIAGLVLELVKKLAADHGSEIDPEACHQISHRTYVDDGAGGGSRSQVERFRGELIDGLYNGTLPQILNLVGLSLKVMIASGDSDAERLALLGDKVLGHRWLPTSDKLIFSIVVNLSSKKRGARTARDLTIGDIDRLPGMIFTRRILLGFVMAQYDPMGLLSPLLVILKIQLRKLYGPEMDLAWDDPVPEPQKAEWIEIITMLLRMGDIILDRAVKPPNAAGPPDLIGFWDGSLLAYSCAIYVRWRLDLTDVEGNDAFFVSLVCGKARVTPVKGITAPRSEVSGFLILTRLLKVVINAMEEKPKSVTLAGDSQCTISATEKSGGTLAPYFASRIAEAMSNIEEVSEYTKIEEIQHVPGALNPADIPTRARTTPDEVRTGSTWQSGPSYLREPKKNWPFSRDFLDVIPTQEMRTPKAWFNLISTDTDWTAMSPNFVKLVKLIMMRSNSWSKTLHVTARVIKAHFYGNRDVIKDPVNVKDLQVARMLQFAVSSTDILQELERGKLDCFRPKVSHGIVYTTGRLGNSLLELFGVEKLPILARDSRLAKLIMIQCHEENHRANPLDVLARSRRHVWIIRGRYLAKLVCKACIVCRKSRADLAKQLMSDIPAHQLRPCPPFTNVSLDFAGPFSARAMGNSRAMIKLWGLVLTCQNTRAVKMLATPGYSTDDFITTYRRFTANFGNPALVVTDAGTQLRKAGQLLEAGDPANLDWERIANGAARNGTVWKCVEAGCQWRNGLAESAVKLVKSTLMLTLASQTTLNYAEIDTLFSCVANTVNWRPIGVKSFTDEDLEALTPNDLLLQRARNDISEVEFDTSDNLTKRQDVMKEIEELWWKQWYNQVLPHLVPYRRWKVECRNLCVGDIVLVNYDRKLKKATYKLARVTAVHPDSHGVVRTVTVAMKKTNRREPSLPYTPRPLEEMDIGIQRLAVICPIEDQVDVNVGETIAEGTV